MPLRMDDDDDDDDDDASDSDPPCRLHKNPPHLFADPCVRIIKIGSINQTKEEPNRSEFN